MATTVLQLVAKITADTRAAEAGIIRTANTAKTAFAPMALAGGVVAAAVVGIGIAATKMAGDFQSGLTSLVTGAGESQKNIKLVSDGILNLATQTGTSTKQLIDGMYMIESAGYHGKAGLDVLKAAAMGAKVGNADLGTVADAVTTVMKDYAGQNVSAAQATNALIATVANGKTHMQDLGQSLAMIAPTASAAHVSLNDMLGAMATMTGEGVPAANAATYLRQMIIALDAPSGQAKKALEGIGLSSTDVAAAMQKSLPNALKMITDHLKQKFPEGSAAYVQALRDISGGSREMQGMLDLTGTHLNDFKTNVGNVGGAVTKGKGSITGWTDVQKTFNFQMDRAKEAGERLMIQLGSKLLPVATQLMGFIADKAVPALKNFATWISGSSTSAEIIRPILITLAIAIGGALVASFVAWAIAAGAAAIATIAATWPVLAIGAGIALLIAGIILLVKHWGDITKFLQNVWKGTMAGVKYDFDQVKKFVENLWGKLEGFGVFLGGKMLGAWNGLRDGVKNAWNNITGSVKSGVNDIIGVVNRMIDSIDAIHINLPSIAGFGGGSIGFNIPHIPYLAAGGTAQSGGFAVVGERGPELINMPRGASVLPLPGGLGGGVGSGGQQVIEIHLTTTLDGRVVAQSVARHLPTVIRNATGARAF